MPLKIYSTSKDEIDKAVFYWMELLAQEKYEEAYSLTLHDPYYEWTPAILESVINGYGLPYETGEEIFKVTSPKTTVLEGGSMVYKDITFFNKSLEQLRTTHNMKVIGHLRYDLPLNGLWSDLSSTFQLLEGQSFWMLELNEIHVF